LGGPGNSGQLILSSKIDR
jgi:hypothetical protein